MRPGPIYNQLNWGGYLIWRLPGYPVAIDGRTNLQADYGSNALNGRGPAKVIAVPIRNSRRLGSSSPKQPRTTALAEVLRLDPLFERIYDDSVAVVFRSRAAATPLNRLPADANPPPGQPAPTPRGRQHCGETTRQTGGLDESQRHGHQRRPVVLRGLPHTHAVLDSLSDYIAVLDHSGTIVAVNRAWCEFAASNGASRPKRGRGGQLP